MPAQGHSTKSVKTWAYVSVALFGILLLVMGYGFYRFPSAPIRYRDGQYVDKRGGVHTRSDFEQLRIWERVFIGSWVAATGSAAAYQFAKRRGKPK